MAAMTRRETRALSAASRVAVMTMVANEADMLPRWVAHYGGQVGEEDLLILDDNSDDGSTEDLACNLIRLPTTPWKQGWGKTRRILANAISGGMLACYDVVIFTDVDEFLVPDPDRYTGLIDYLDAHREKDVIAPLALNVLHNPRKEPPLDHTQPVLRQRRFVKFQGSLCKPVIKRIPAPWLAAFHGIQATYDIDPDLLMLHLKFYDVDALRPVAEHRRAAHEKEGRGSPASAWPVHYDQLVAGLLSWVDVPEGFKIPQFHPTHIDFTDVVRAEGGGFYRSEGPWRPAMEDGPLFQLPERYSEAL